MKHELKAVITELNEDPKSQLLGKATLIVNSAIHIRNITIHDSPNGPFIRMPRQVKTDNNGIGYITDIVRISYPELDKDIHNVIISAYNYAKAVAEDDKKRAKRRAREIKKYGFSWW